MVTAIALIIGMGTAVLVAVTGFTLGVVRVLGYLDAPPRGEPAWWPDFERQFTDYVEQLS